MRDGIMLAAKLGLMMLIAGLCLGVTYSVTKAPIDEQAILTGVRLRAEVLVGADNTSPVEVPDAPDTLIQAYKADNGAGFVFEMSAPGFAGRIGVTIGIRADGTIEGVRIGDHTETPGLGAKAADEEFYGLFTERPAAEINVVRGAPSGDGEIQAITAATITSRAVTNAVNDAVACYQALTR